MVSKYLKESSVFKFNGKKKKKQWTVFKFLTNILVQATVVMNKMISNAFMR